MKTGISVVICCYNSENRIGKVLDHLQNQKDTEDIEWEVIVVDNNSSDNTTEVAKRSWKDENVNQRVIFEEKPGLSHARLKGLNSSQFSYIVFIDDDNLVDENYIRMAYRIMNENPEVGLAGGLGIPLSEGELPFWFDKFHDAYAVGPQADKKGYPSRSYLHGAGLIMRKSAWNYIINNGFHFLLSGRKGKSMSSGEDYEISSAFTFAGYKMWYDPDLKFHHIIPEGRLKWDYIRKLAVAFGKSYVILQVYIAEFKDYRGWNKVKFKNWFVGTLVCLYNLTKYAPPFIYYRIRGIEGKKREYDFLFQYGFLLQRLELIFLFSGRKKEIYKLHRDLKKGMKEPDKP